MVDTDNSSNSETTISRRPFVKSAISGAMAMSVAGCTGSSGNGSSSGESNNNSSQGTANSSSGIEGVSFTFWDAKYFAESRQSDQAITDAVARFNERTGANAQLNKQQGEQPLVESFNSGNQPAVFTQSMYNAGKFINADQIVPFSDYRNQHANYVENLADGVQEYLDFCYAGWEGDNYAVPMTTAPFAPFVARADHFEKAGLSIKNDFPPKNYDDLIRIATQLENNGPGTGYQVYGDPADMYDVQFTQWTVAEGGNKGMGFTDDWSDVRFDNDVWKKVTRQYNKVYNEHGFGTGQTPTLTDEDAINLMIQGDLSMASHASFNQTVFMERAGDLFEDGTLVWGKPWGGKKSNPAFNLTFGANFSKTPEGKDQATWEKKQRAAHQFVNYLSTSGFMSETMPNLGFLPSRTDTVNNIEVGKLDNVTPNWYSVNSSIQPKSKFGFECHPLREEIYMETFAAEGQKMLQGQQTPEEACDNAAEKARRLNQDTQFG